MTQLRMSQTHHSMKRDFELLEMIRKPSKHREKLPKRWENPNSSSLMEYGMDCNYFRIYWIFY